MPDNRPIGIFDSGIGGLTVASAISGLLPNERIIYFGDTAHLPYGDKSPELIKQFSLRLADYLINQWKCKSIIIACNTASAVAYEYLRDKHKGIRPIFNVIDPIIEAIVSDDEINQVGLIATKTTVNSGVYQEKLQRRKPSVSYTALATPLLVPMIEEGFGHDNISHEVIHEYLTRSELQNIDALILGCTHYVTIREELNEFYKGSVKLFDSTDIVATKVKQILDKEGLLADQKTEANQFLVSDFTDGFAKSAERFYGENVKLELCEI